MTGVHTLRFRWNFMVDLFFFKSSGGIAQFLQKQLSAKLKKIPVEKGFEHLLLYFVLGEGLCQFARE